MTLGKSSGKMGMVILTLHMPLHDGDKIALVLISDIEIVTQSVSGILLILPDRKKQLGRGGF